MSKILVYRQGLLPYSETFILNQSAAFGSLRPVLFGLERVPGLNTDAVPSRTVFSGGRVDRLNINQFKLMRKHPQVRQEIGMLGPAAILAHFANDGIRMGPTANSLDIPMGVFVHGTDVLMRDSYARRQGLSWRQLARGWSELFDRTKHFYACSEFLAARLVERGADAGRVTGHHVGVPVRPLKEEDQRSNEVLFVGRLVENKGLHHLIAAVGALRGDGVCIRVIGDGPERPALEALARAVAPGQVTFSGALRPAEVSTAMSRAALVCVPSMTTASGAGEGLGMVSLEAQERARPVVAYATGGLPETLIDGETGLVVRSGDVVGLRDAVSQLMRDPEERASMGSRGRTRILSDFDVQKQTALLETKLCEHLELS